MTNELKLINMQDVKCESVEWLLYPFIPYGKITIIQGDPGEGKTTLVLTRIVYYVMTGRTNADKTVDVGLKSFIQRGLNSDKAKRFQNVSEMIQAFRHI